MDEVSSKTAVFSGEKRFREYFFYSVAVLLFVAGTLKLFAALGSAWLLGQPDPVLHMSNRSALLLTGGLELSLSAYLLMAQNGSWKPMLTVWLLVLVLGHRFGLLWLSGPHLFSCLGNLTDWFPVAPRIMDRVFYFLYGVPLAGTYILLVLNWLPNRVRVPESAMVAKAKHSEGGA